MIVTGPDGETSRQSRRPRLLRVLIDIADRALRADTADACDEAGIAVADNGASVADVVLIDRPVATAGPAIALVESGTRQAWPAAVRAVVPADTSAEMLAAIITVVAAGFALTREHGGGADAGIGDANEAGTEEDEAEEADAEEADAVDLGHQDSGSDQSVAKLSVREREVLALLAGGASNKEIALSLGLSVSTVKFHVAAITEKLGARSRVDAVAIAVRRGLVMV